MLVRKRGSRYHAGIRRAFSTAQPTDNSRAVRTFYNTDRREAGKRPKPEGFKKD